MSSQAQKPTAPALADEAASLVAAAEDLAKWAATQKTKGLDFSVDSLGRLDELLDRLSRSKDPITIKTRLGRAAYIGEVMVRRLDGRWGTGELYGEVLPPGVELIEGGDEPEGLARPTAMVERRLAEKVSLKQQVLEQGKAWAPAEEPVPEPSPADAPQPVPEPAPDAGPTPEEIEASARAEEDRLAAEQAAAEKIEAAALAEEDRLAAEQAEADKAEADKAEAEQAAADKAEAEQAEADKAETEKAETEKAETEKAEAERAEADRLAAEQAAADKAEADKAEAEKAEAEQAEAEKAAADRLAAEQAEAARIEAAEKAAAEKAEADRVAAERVAAEKVEAERLLAEQAGTMMRQVAEAFVGPATANGAVWLDYTPASVMLLDDLIAAWWPSAPEKGTYESMIPAMGAYVGEVLVRVAGGRWIRDPGEGYAVDVGGRIVFPMKQVAGRFELGAGQSIGRFYTEASAGPSPGEGKAAEQPAKKRKFFLRRG